MSRKSSRNRGFKSRSLEEGLKSKNKEYEKQIRQLRRYVRQLEDQIGIDTDFEDLPEPDGVLVTEEKVVEICAECLGQNIVYVNTFKIDKPITIKVCKDCKVRSVI